ncbi:TolB-like translocation protein [Hyalangium gracile]|uniref:hypothetical protein n=1 Tax=Hyalangium gracile TaxID=394092 RepID=UPI001CCACEB8|nr:hypothetical protein [Hyalangium gracile]
MPGTPAPWHLAALLTLLALPATAGEPPPLEPIEVEQEIPVPPEVSASDYAARLLPDARHVLLTFRQADGLSQLATLRRDGGGFQCLTCGLELSSRGALGDVAPFQDMRRLMISTQEAPAGVEALRPLFGKGDIQAYILECAPSLLDCQQRAMLPVRHPADGFLQGVQNREHRLFPDDRHVLWTEVGVLDGPRMILGQLVRHASEYVVIEPRVFNPPYQLGEGPEGWTLGGRHFEANEIGLGGRTVMYQSQGSALNGDVFEFDLATGLHRRVTHHLDYSELSFPSPDGTRLAYTSARGLERTNVFTQVVRPSLIDMVAWSQLGRLALWNNRQCLNEMWLMDRQGERGTYGGQPLLLEEGWTLARKFDWFPDGTRALIKEERVGGKGKPGTWQRLRILRFPARAPTPPVPIVDISTLELERTTVPYDAYTGLAARQVPGRTIHGQHSGTATLTFLGSFSGGSWRVRYSDYSDDGESFLSGTESLTTPSPILLGRWEADLTVRGRNTGFLRGTLTLLGALAEHERIPFQGQVVSEVNGHRLEGVPTQDSCPLTPQPPLELLEARATGSTAGWAEVTVRVAARVADDPTARPVLGATVSIAGREVETNAEGVALLALPATPGEVLHLSARAGSFKPTAAAVTVDSP